MYKSNVSTQQTFSGTMYMSGNTMSERGIKEIVHNMALSPRNIFDLI